MKTKDFIMKPMIDVCFKGLMEHEAVRRGFLAAVLDTDPEDIQSTELLPTHLQPRYADDKLGILDIYVRMKDGERVNIEIQLVSFKWWANRSLFYLCRMFESQLRQGGEYAEIKKCIQISILDFELFPEHTEFYSKFQMLETAFHFLYSDLLEMHVLELPKLKKHQYPETALLSWAKFISSERRDEMQLLAEEEESVRKAFEELKRISSDESKRWEYEAREKALRDHISYIRDYTERGIAQGLEQGLKQGLKQGRQEGIAEGIKVLIESCRELGVSRQDTRSRLLTKYELSEQQADEFMDKFWG